MKGVHYVLGHPFSMSMDWTPRKRGEGSHARSLAPRSGERVPRSGG